MTKITDETPIAMLTVGQLKEILGIDRILGNLTAHQTPTEQVMTVEEVVRLTGYSFASRSMADGDSTFSAKRSSTGCRANRTRRSNRKTSGK